MVPTNPRMRSDLAKEVSQSRHSLHVLLTLHFTALIDAISGKKDSAIAQLQVAEAESIHSDSASRYDALCRERRPVGYDIRHNEDGDHQDVNVTYEVRRVLKVKAQGETIEEKYKGHAVRANRPNTVLSELPIARGKNCCKGANDPKSRKRISEVAEAWRLCRTHEERHQGGNADGPNVNSTEYSVNARIALAETS